MREALRFWETRRLIYNAVLVGMTVLAFGGLWIMLTEPPSFVWRPLITLALWANGLYSLGYLTEARTLSVSDGDDRRRLREIWFVIGTAASALLALVAASITFVSAGEGGID